MMMWLGARVRFWRCRSRLGHRERLEERAGELVARAVKCSTWPDMLGDAEFWALGALKLHPRHPEALVLLGRINRQGKAYDDAHQRMKEAVDAINDRQRELLPIREDLLSTVAVEGALCCGEAFHLATDLEEQETWAKRLDHWGRILQLEDPGAFADLVDNPVVVELRDQLLALLPADEVGKASEVRR